MLNSKKEFRTIISKREVSQEKIMVRIMKIIKIYLNLISLKKKFTTCRIMMQNTLISNINTTIKVTLSSINLFSKLRTQLHRLWIQIMKTTMKNKRLNSFSKSSKKSMFVSNQRTRKLQRNKQSILKEYAENAICY